MAAKNRVCNVCGKAYEYCNNCSDNGHKGETWRNIYCSENCKKIFDVLSAQAFNHITDKEAKEKLKELDLSKVDTFKDSYKKQIRQIQSVSTNEEKTQSKEKEIVKHGFKK